MKVQKLKINYLLFIAAIMGLSIVSCSESNSDLVPAQINSTVETELIVNDIIDENIELADEAMDLVDSNLSTQKGGNIGNENSERRDSVRGNRNNIRFSECVTITRVITASLVTTTIDFGEVNCLCNDGRERRGKIIISHEGRYWDSTAYITFGFENFFVDENQVLGEKTITQIINADGNRESSILVDVSVILADGSGTVTFTAEKTRIVVVGSDTHTKRDDVTETTGGSILTSPDGSQAVMTIIEPLVRKNEEGCYMYIVQGIRQIEKTGKSMITINYGDGTCDNLAELTVDGVTTVIELKRKKN